MVRCRARPRRTVWLLLLRWAAASVCCSAAVGVSDQHVCKGWDECVEGVVLMERCCLEEARWIVHIDDVGLDVRYISKKNNERIKNLYNDLVQLYL